MVVIKKSDKEEKFSYKKLGESIHAANINSEETLDVELILAEFRTIVMDKDFITTGQINVIVYGLLCSKNAWQTLKNFMEFNKYE